MGPLEGFRIIEIAGIGPGPFCGMLLADMGASLIRIERPGGSDGGRRAPPEFDLMNRGRPTIEADLKTDDGKALVLALCENADALFEGFRPGVMEKLGLGPAACMAVNEKLVYGRVTGWGQDGPLAATAGHDGNYAALSGALGAIGQKSAPPTVPLNLVADFGGGGAYLAIGLLAALLEAGRSGKGQVVDAAMVDGAASLMTMFYGLKAGGLWQDERESNILDGAAPFYRAYRTNDDKHVFLGAIEPRFFAEFVNLSGIGDIKLADQYDRSKWPGHIRQLAELFASRSQADWMAVFDGSDACVSPVMTLREAPDHPHNIARGTFVDIGGIVQPAPAPRFSRTASSRAEDGVGSGKTAADILRDWGCQVQLSNRVY